MRRFVNRACRVAVFVLSWGTIMGVLGHLSGLWRLPLTWQSVVAVMLLISAFGVLQWFTRVSKEEAPTGRALGP
jgi:hypothetical protein